MRGDNHKFRERDSSYDSGFPYLNLIKSIKKGETKLETRARMLFRDQISPGRYGGNLRYRKGQKVTVNGEPWFLSDTVDYITGKVGTQLPCLDPFMSDGFIYRGNWGVSGFVYDGDWNIGSIDIGPEGGWWQGLWECCVEVLPGVIVLVAVLGVLSYIYMWYYKSDVYITNWTPFQWKHLTTRGSLWKRIDSIDYIRNLNSRILKLSLDTQAADFFQLNNYIETVWYLLSYIGL